jgi:hypothetical protein
VPNPSTANAAMNHRGSRYGYSLSSNYSLKEGSSYSDCSEGADSHYKRPVLVSQSLLIRRSAQTPEIPEPPGDKSGITSSRQRVQRPDRQGDGRIELGQTPSGWNRCWEGGRLPVVLF